MPVLDPRRARDDVAGTDHLDRLAPLLCEADARHDQQALPERVRVPGRASTGIEGHHTAGRVDAALRRPDGLDAYPTREVVGRARTGRLRAGARDLLLGCGRGRLGTLPQ